MTSLEVSIKKLKTNQNKITAKMHSVINNENSTDNISSLQENWFDVSTQLAVLNGQLDNCNKERAKIIKKADSYFTKLDSKVKKTKTPKKASKKSIPKTTTKTKEPKEEKKTKESKKVVPKPDTKKI